jgi:phage terminase small subunit
MFKGKTQVDAYKCAYDASKMKDKTAYEKACLIASKDKIRARLKELQDEFKNRNMVTIERVLAEYAKLGFFDPRKLFHDDGKPKDITELDDETAAAVAGLDIQEVYEGFGEDRVFVGYTKKYKLTDKKTALDSMAKYLGMFTEKVEIFGKDGGTIKVELVDD